MLRRPWPRLRRLGVRVHATIAAVTVVLVALLGGGATLLVLLQNQLINDAAAQTSAMAHDVAARYTTAALPATPHILSDLRHKGLQIQIVNSANEVVAAGHPEDLETSMVHSVAGPSGKATTYREGSSDLTNDDGLVTSVGFVNDGRAYAVNVRADVDVQDSTVRTVGLYLVVALPGLLALVGILTWLLVGRALRAVEDIRAQVERVHSSRRGQRVAVPPSGDEIARLASTMNRMLARLEASDQAQRQFTSDASHELRNPLATLTAILEIAIADKSGRTWIDMQPVLLAQTTRMTRLVDDLLTLAKGDDRGVQLHRTEQDLDDVVETEVQQMRGAAQHAIEVQTEPVRTYCDGPRIAQVVRNLIDNADRHAESTVWVRLQARPTSAVVTVDNDGPLVPIADRERVFERFVRLDDSRSRGDGNSGLGLAIVANFVTAHGGTVMATESPEGRCRFEFTLPLNAHSGSAPDVASRGEPLSSTP